MGKSHKEREEHMVWRLERLAGKYREKIDAAASSGNADVIRGVKILKGREKSFGWMADTIKTHGAEVAMQVMRSSTIAMISEHYTNGKALRTDSARNQGVAERFDMAAYTSKVAERIYWECFFAPEPKTKIDVSNPPPVNGSRVARNHLSANENVAGPGEHPLYLPSGHPPGGTLWREIAEGVLADAVEWCCDLDAHDVSNREAAQRADAYDFDRQRKYGRGVWEWAVCLVKTKVSVDQGGPPTLESGISQQAPETPDPFEMYANGGSVGRSSEVPAGEAPPEIAMSLADKLTSIWEGPEVPLADLFRAIDSADLSEIAKFEEVCRKCDPCVWPEAEAEHGMTGSREWHDLNERMAEKFGPRVWAVVKRCVALQRVGGRAPKGDS